MHWPFVHAGCMGAQPPPPFTEPLQNADANCAIALTRAMADFVFTDEPQSDWQLPPKGTIVQSVAVVHESALNAVICFARNDA